MMSFHRFFTATVAAAALLGAIACAQTGAPATAAEYTPKVGQAGKDVMWVPTPQALVDRMLDMAQLSARDRLVDLGSGDGRLVITAAKRGASARGIEYNPDLVALARRHALEQGVAERATFEQADIFQSDFSQATVVTLFLLPELNLQLRPILLRMPAGTRIVANSFDMGDWKPDETALVTEGCTAYCNALKWTVPANVAGTWDVSGKALNLRQTYQILEGTLDGQEISDARVNGTRIYFSVGTQHYSGEVSATAMRGTIGDSRPWQARRSAR